MLNIPADTRTYSPVQVRVSLPQVPLAALRFWKRLVLVGLATGVALAALLTVLRLRLVSLRACGFPYQKVRAQLFRSSAMAPARSATAWIKSWLGSLVSKMLKPPSTSNIWPPARATRLVGPSLLG